MTAAKTLFPNMVTFTNFGDYDMDIFLFLGGGHYLTYHKHCKHF